jgi:hypothetical protein
LDAPVVSVIEKPSWLNLQDNGNGSGSLSGTVPTGHGGIFPIELRVSDGVSRTVSQSYSLVTRSTNGAPIIVASPSLQAIPLKEYSFDLTAFDPDDDVVVIYASILPSWLKLERRGPGLATVRGVPTFADARNETIEIVATDGLNEDRQTYAINISASWWASSESLGQGQWRKNWFGQFSLSGSSWIYHEHLGWVFAEGTQPDSVWFWAEGWGWLWTSSQHWNSDTGEGHVYSFDEAAWFYLRSYGSPQNAKLYRYSTEEWMPLLLEGN